MHLSICGVNTRAFHAHPPWRSFHLGPSHSPKRVCTSSCSTHYTSLLAILIILHVFDISHYIHCAQFKMIPPRSLARKPLQQPEGPVPSQILSTWGTITPETSAPTGRIYTEPAGTIERLKQRAKRVRASWVD
jgi:hypothetical protein